MDKSSSGECLGAHYCANFADFINFAAINKDESEK